MKLSFNNKKINLKTQLILLLIILIGLWLIIYFIPEIFLLLVNTLLGNIILLILIIIVFLNNKIYAIIIIFIIIIIYRIIYLKEGFILTGSFTFNEEEDKSQQNIIQDLQKKFKKIQNSINKNTYFDMNQINNQVSQEELTYFNKNGKWPWSQKVISLFEEAINSNPYVRTVPKQATNYARTIYNQTAILTILSYQTKEGQFLLNGVLVKDPSGNKMEELPSGFGNFPYESGLLDNRVDDIIQCNMDSNKLERIRSTAKGGIFGEQTETITPVNYNNLETIIPGFTFINNPCNPCVALAETPNYSCPYQLKIKNKPPFISKVWQYLWGINNNPL